MNTATAPASREPRPMPTEIVELMTMVDGARKHRLIAMEIGSRVPIGYVEVLWDEGHTYIVELWVRPHARGRGHARRLMDAALAIARCGTNPIHLWVLHDNPIRAWYERMGWVEFSEPDGDPDYRYYRAPAVDGETR